MFRDNFSKKGRSKAINNGRGTIMRLTSPCAHCGRAMNNFAGGYSRGYNGEKLCHPNEKNRPDCYRLVTLYKHETPCNRPICYEDRTEFMDYVNYTHAPELILEK